MRDWEGSNQICNAVRKAVEICGIDRTGEPNFASHEPRPSHQAIFFSAPEHVTAGPGRKNFGRLLRLFVLFCE